MRDDAVVHDLGEVRLDSPEISGARRTLLGEAGRRGNVLLTSSAPEGTCAVRRLRGLVPHEPALLEIAADVRVVQP
jgi:hypothetical protein